MKLVPILAVLGLGALVLGSQKKAHAASGGGGGGGASPEAHHAQAVAAELLTLPANAAQAIKILLDPNTNATKDAYTSAAAQMQAAGKPALTKALSDIYMSKFGA